MYAVIESGGKQHRVVQGETLKLEKLELGEGFFQGHLMTTERECRWADAHGGLPNRGGPSI